VSRAARTVRRRVGAAVAVGGAVGGWAAAGELHLPGPPSSPPRGAEQLEELGVGSGGWWLSRGAEYGREPVRRNGSRRNKGRNTSMSGRCWGPPRLDDGATLRCEQTLSYLRVLSVYRSCAYF
jgi:hypothetical protein